MTGLIIALVIVITMIIVLGVYYNNKTKSSEQPVSTPTPVETVPSVQYIGCYADGPDGARDFSGKYRQETDFASCVLVGRNTGSKYIGFQGNPQTGTGTCWYGDTYGKYGKGADCIVKDPAGNIMGQWDNAVYQLN